MLPTSQQPQEFGETRSASAPPRQSAQAGTRSCWKPEVETVRQMTFISALGLSAPESPG